jgi:hypothetical protein
MSRYTRTMPYSNILLYNIIYIIWDVSSKMLSVIASMISTLNANFSVLNEYITMTKRLIAHKDPKLCEDILLEYRIKYQSINQRDDPINEQK